jgi:dTDP-4-amino-4,6-dideoxygalactose transaminase
MLYLNPDPGDEVLVTPVSDMGSVIPIMAQLAVPVFVDIDPVTQNLDPAAIEAAITPRTRAIMVPHIYGAPADMDPIMKIARAHDLFVIEDCAQAHLTRYKGRLVGTIGDIGCFSFQQSKHMTTGDGGIVLINEDEKFGRKLRLCMDKGWPRDRGGRDHLFLAPNYHMTELQAAVGLAQLKKLPEMVSRRRAAGHALREMLSQVPGLRHVDPLPDSYETYFFFPFALDLDHLKTDGVGIAKALQAEGIEGFLGYPGPIPLYQYPVIRDHKTFGASGWPFTLPGVTRQDFSTSLCPRAEAACKQTILLWWNENISLAHCTQIAAAIRKVLSHYYI